MECGDSYIKLLIVVVYLCYGFPKHVLWVSKTWPRVSDLRSLVHHGSATGTQWQNTVGGLPNAKYWTLMWVAKIFRPKLLPGYEPPPGI